jgi:hypothetical protein
MIEQKLLSQGVLQVKAIPLQRIRPQKQSPSMT